MHEKEVLAEFIYKLNIISNFRCESKFWSSPVHGFSYDDSLPKKFIRELQKYDVLSEGTNAIICILGDWPNIAEGIVLTDRAIYLNSPKNEDKYFKVYYEAISDLEYIPDLPKLKIRTEDRCFSINTPLWSKRNLHDFLQFAAGKYEFDSKNSNQIVELQLQTAAEASVGVLAAGITYGNISNASSLYFDDKIVSPRGHGFAAEHANHVADLFQGKRASIVGDNNAKNGADRLVNDVYIQSKYCKTGSKCVEECFKNGTFRYWNPDGSPMQIEVPSDKAADAVKAMRARIERGQVPGITDPNEAENIIRPGHFTYNQVRNIAKAGTVESIIYDASTGTIIAANTFGITTVLTLAVGLWNGEDFDIALKSAATQGLKVGGTAFISSVLAGQLSKAGLNSALVGGSEAIVQAIGPKASAMLVNAFRSGTNIYGAAAMKSAAKLLRGNVMTGVASIVILSIGDIGNIFSGRISASQLFKNMANTASTVVGGGAGWVAGATAGSTIGSIIPGVGTAIGGVVGGVIGAFAGGSAASKVSETVTDCFIEDDADKMMKIIQEVFQQLAGEYLTGQTEAEEIVDKLKGNLTGGTLKDMFGSNNRSAFARDLLTGYFETAAKNRMYIHLPTARQMQRGLRGVLEDIADSSADIPYEVKQSCAKSSHTDKFYVDYEYDPDNILGEHYWELYELPNNNKVSLPKEADMYSDACITVLGFGNEICIITPHKVCDKYECTSVLLDFQSGTAVCKGSWDKEVLAFDSDYIVFDYGDTLKIVNRWRPTEKNILHTGGFDGILFNNCVVDEDALVCQTPYTLEDGKLYFHISRRIPDTMDYDELLVYFDLKEKQLYDVAILKNFNSGVADKIISAGEYIYIVANYEGIWAVNMRTGRVRIITFNDLIEGRIKDYIAYLSDEGMGVIKLSNCEIQTYPYEKMAEAILDLDESSLAGFVFLWESEVYIEEFGQNETPYRIDLASGSLQAEKVYLE